MTSAAPTSPPPAPPPTKKAPMSWKDLRAHVEMLNAPDHQIVTVWHPDAAGEFIATGQGNVRAMVGDARYQLSSGDFVEL
jgi:hypothetical protein